METTLPQGVKPRLDARKWPTHGFSLAVGISVFCLISTYISCQLASQPSGLLRYVSDFFTLTLENNFGTWWSTTMLFIASLQAFDGFVRARGGMERQRTEYAWLAVAAICLVFSIDEGASIHERIGTWTGMGMWESSAPFGLVLFSLIAFAVHRLWRDPAQRANSVWLMISMALFGTVMVQEHLEFQTHWWGSFAGFRALLEEGTEISGMLILLKITMGNSLSQRPEGGSGNPSIVDVIEPYRRPLWWALILLTPFIAQVSARLPDQNRGHPAAWAAAMIFFLVALTLRDVTLRGMRPVHSAILAMLGGAMSVQAFVLPSEMDVGISRRLIAFILTFVLFVVIQFSAPVRTSWPAKITVTALAGILVVLPFAIHSLFVQNLVVLFAALCAWHCAGPASDE